MPKWETYPCSNSDGGDDVDIEFTIGQPSKNILAKAYELMGDASAALARDAKDGGADVRVWMQYGASEGSRRYRRACAAISKSMSSTHTRPQTEIRVDKVTADDLERIFATNGCSAALDLVATTFLDKGDTVLVEQNTYFLAMQTFFDHGMNVVAAPVDKDGLIVDATFDTLIEKTKPKAVYVIPTHQNPTGSALPLERRRRLVQLAKQENMLVLSDDVYDNLWFPASSNEHAAAANAVPLVDLDESRVVSMCTFSKILAPGLRLGWIKSSPSNIKKLSSRGYVQSGGGLNPFTGEIVATAVESGALSSHIDVVRRMLQRRYEALERSVSEHLPFCQWESVRGGYFFWLQLPKGVSATALHAEAAQLPKGQRVGFLCGDRTSPPASSASESIRISFSYYNPEMIAEGIKRIAKLPSLRKFIPRR